MKYIRAIFDLSLMMFVTHVLLSFINFDDWIIFIFILARLIILGFGLMEDAA